MTRLAISTSVAAFYALLVSRRGQQGNDGATADCNEFQTNVINRKTSEAELEGFAG
jgi:hypothetical protein